MRSVGLMSTFIMGFILGGCGAPVAETSTTTTPTSQTSSIAQETGPSDLSTPKPCPVDPQTLEFMQPIPWSAADALNRWGQGVELYAMLKTSQAVPAEVCGARASYELIAGLKCNDGTHPLPDLSAARDSRIGSVGGGGRCGMVIDLYAVQCPEQAYEIFVDMYHCAPGESLM